MEPLDVDAWYAAVRRAAPYRTLPRTAFDATLDMLAGRYPSDDFSGFRPLLIWDRETGQLSARPGAKQLAITSGGTIPDRGMFSVVLPEGEERAGSRRVGELDEEMVYESRINDVITLGAASWRIQEITRDQVVVIPAPGSILTQKTGAARTLASYGFRRVSFGPHGAQCGDPGGPVVADTHRPPSRYRAGPRMDRRSP
ncbi:hypothetical protein DZA65_01433 [Dickeya dianthicola]|nr:hypothetical protein DZA65_01433 [Dickeya dianthicola]